MTDVLGRRRDTGGALAPSKHHIESVRGMTPCPSRGETSKKVNPTGTLIFDFHPPEL